MSSLPGVGGEHRRDDEARGVRWIEAAAADIGRRPFQEVVEHTSHVGSVHGPIPPPPRPFRRCAYTPGRRRNPGLLATALIITVFFLRSFYLQNHLGHNVP
jgi:hypothetical protein